MSTMAPIMVFNGDGKLALITGSPEVHKFQYKFAALVNILDFNLDIGEVTMLRIHQDSQEPELLLRKQ